MNKKCSEINTKDDYTNLSSVINNPYGYSFGSSLPKSDIKTYSKIYNKVNRDIINKKSFTSK